MIKFHKETSQDWIINRPPPNDYYNSILQLCGDAFVNAGTGWAYSDNITYVNSTTSTQDFKIATLEIYHQSGGYYIRFWNITPYNNYYHSAYSFLYQLVYNNEGSNTSSKGGDSSYPIRIYYKNLCASNSGGNYYYMPYNLFCAIAKQTMNSDFGYDLHTFSGLLPFDICRNYSSSSVNINNTVWAISSGASGSAYPGGYSKTFWTLTDDSGNYNVFGFGHAAAPIKYSRCHCFGRLLSNFDSQDTEDEFAFYDLYRWSESSPIPSTLSRYGTFPSSSTYDSFDNKSYSAFSKDGTLFNDRHLHFTDVYSSNPRQFKFGNKINYTPLRVCLQSNDTNDPLVENGQSNKGFVSTDYIRYIGTDYPGTSANLWRTFDNKNWMLLTPGYLFRWDPTAPDMRNF